MAKATKSSNASSSLRKVTKKRPGIHSKKKSSKCKNPLFKSTHIKQDQSILTFFCDKLPAWCVALNMANSL